MGESLDAISAVTLMRVLLGILMGSAARFVTLRVDSRQVPSYPNS
ncbi:hypothetical protein SDC9_66390 [bioreactor metagenome]|uniref:Uncharacterized protein n=1 Tax=bioreactor metagenome TaxID=1076179 RepID=A0A644Y0A3_9ZZZZ